MKEREGYLWPDNDLYAFPAVMGGARTDIPLLLSLVRGRACIIQAGANVGVYPLALAQEFDRVVTVEPDRENFACLTANLTNHPAEISGRIERSYAAFGEQAGMCVVEEVGDNNCGAHRTRPGGEVPVITIDSLVLEACDCIWLDIEGSELAALKGAEQVIRRFSPVIAIEDKGLEEAYGIPFGTTAAWLEARGYQHVAQISNDKVFTQGRIA